MSKVWMPLYIGDYTRDTMHLSCEEHGAYLQLMMHYWETGPLPDSDARLARIVKISAHKWKKISPTVREFFTSKDGFLYHKRIDQEKARAAENSEKKAKAAQARWGANEEQKHMHVHMQTQCPSPSPNLPSEDIGRAKRASPKRKTKIPQGFPGPTEITWAVEHEHVPRETAEREATKFRRDAEAKAKTFAMWDRAWQNWITGGLEKGWIGQKPKQSQSEKDDAAFREAARRIGANQ